MKFVHTSPLLRLLPFVALLVVAGACAEGAALNDDDGNSPIATDRDGSAGDARADASGSSGSASSSGGSGSSSSGSTSSSGGDAGADSGPPLTACQQALAQINFDFEDFDPSVNTGNIWRTRPLDGFTPDDTRWPFNPWYISTAGTAVITPACPNGKCMGTELTRNYAQCQRGEMISPGFDLSACSGANVVMKFEHAYNFKDHGDNTRDGGLIEISGNSPEPTTGTFTQLGTALMPGTIRIRGSAFGRSCLETNNFYVHNKSGYVGAHAMEVVELPVPTSALTANARVRFLMSSGVAADTNSADASRTSTGFGWRVDNIRFEQKL